MSRFDDIYVRCPFFLRRKKDRICCAGMFEGHEFQQKYEYADTMNYQVIKHCRDKFEECPVYKILAEAEKENDG